MRPYFEPTGIRPQQTLCVSTLPEAIVEQINGYTLDLLLDQRHYLSWKSLLSDSAFLRLRGYTILLPVGVIAHPILPATHIYIETHENSLVFLLHDEAAVLPDTMSEDAMLSEIPAPNSYIVRCQKFPQQPFFITTLYHACYLQH